MIEEVRKKILEIYHAYKHRLPLLALVGGSVFDWLTLNRPDTLFANASIISYFTIVGGCILLLNKRKSRGEEEEHFWLLVLMQFCFGNLASGLLVLYSQSTTWTGGLLFVALLFAFLISNEFARSRYAHLRAHLITYYILLTAYAGIVTPILLKTIGMQIFFIGSLAAFGIMVGYLFILYSLAPVRVKSGWRSTVAGMCAVMALTNGLYYFNLIPPVPLSISDLGVYYHVERKADTYIREGEAEKNWYDPLRYFGQPTLTIPQDGRLYCFSAVFAPTGLSTPIRHRWQLWSVDTHTWIDDTIISFPIYGGRADGYRGYTIKNGVTPGKWRCVVETQSGSVIGRAAFIVHEGKTSTTTQSVYH